MGTAHRKILSLCCRALKLEISQQDERLWRKPCQAGSSADAGFILVLESAAMGHCVGHFPEVIQILKVQETLVLEPGGLVGPVHRAGERQSNVGWRP